MMETAVTLCGQVMARAYLSIQSRFDAWPTVNSHVLSEHSSGTRFYGMTVSASNSGIHRVQAVVNLDAKGLSYGKIDATIVDVHRHLPVVEGPLLDAEGKEVPEELAPHFYVEEREFSDQELAEQLALLDKEPGIEIPAGPEAFTE